MDSSLERKQARKEEKRREKHADKEERRERKRAEKEQKEKEKADKTTEKKHAKKEKKKMEYEKTHDRGTMSEIEFVENSQDDRPVPPLVPSSEDDPDPCADTQRDMHEASATEEDEAPHRKPPAAANDL